MNLCLCLSLREMSEEKKRHRNPKQSRREREKKLDDSDRCEEKSGTPSNSSETNMSICLTALVQRLNQNELQAEIARKMECGREREWQSEQCTAKIEHSMQTFKLSRCH